MELASGVRFIASRGDLGKLETNLYGLLPLLCPSPH